MEIKEMNLKDVEERLNAIREEIENDDADIDALETEVRNLNVRKEELHTMETRRKEKIMEIRSGMGEVIRTFEEEKKLNRTFAPDTIEYRDAYLKNLQGKTLNAEERAAVSATAAIPTETMNMIIGRLEMVPLLSAVDMTYIPGNVTYPVEGTVNDASWVVMGTAATDSADTITSISLSAYKLIKTIEITADVAAMAISAFQNWLVSRLSNKIQFAIDKAILTGTGSNQATGILKSGEVTNTGTYTKTAMKYGDLMKIIAALPTKYLPGASFIMPRAVFYGEVLGLEDTTGNRVVVADAQAPAKFNILGYPVIVDDNCSADTVIFGDLKEYKFNFAKAVEVKSDESVAFRTGSTVYRAMCLADGKIADKNAFAVFTKATA